ncbi:MAG: hypothetical protein E7003_07305 [Eggerthellaceae bacterium]|nr:hypothetical protein [Eggerthellaceae bacterium]
MDRNWVFALCMTVLFSIVYATALGDVTIGICLGICTGIAFGLLDFEKGDKHTAEDGKKHEDTGFKR